MEIFLTLFIKLIPLYVIIFLGFIAGKYSHVNKESIAQLLIKIIVPVVMFTGVAKTEITLATISIPILFYLICCILSFLIFFISGFIWKDSTKNILAFTAGSGNTGYFGLPVAVLLFGDGIIGIAALVVLGTALFANSIGFFLVAMGHHTRWESFMRVLKLPILYACLFGMLVSIAGIQLPEVFIDTATYFNGAFIVLGMMIIGLGLADIKIFKFDLPYIAISLFTKFVLWPLLMIGVLFIDTQYLSLFDSSVHKMLLLMTIVPVAANVVMYATFLKTHPEKAAIDVLISTLVALFYVPLIAAYFLK